MRRATRAEPEAARQEIRLEDRIEHGIFTPTSTTPSRTAGINSGLCSLVPGFEMNTRRASNGRYCPSPNSAASLPRSRDAPPSPNVRQADTVNSSGAAIRAHILPRPVQAHSLRWSLAEQRMEASQSAATI